MSDADMFFFQCQKADKEKAWIFFSIHSFLCAALVQHINNPWHDENVFVRRGESSLRETFISRFSSLILSFIRRNGFRHISSPYEEDDMAI